MQLTNAFDCDFRIIRQFADDVVVVIIVHINDGFNSASSNRSETI